MGRIAATEVFEAEQLLQKVESWTEEEIQQLPKLYQKKARELQRREGEE